MKLKKYQGNTIPVVSIKLFGEISRNLRVSVP